MTDTNQFEIVF